MPNLKEIQTQLEKLFTDGRLDELFENLKSVLPRKSVKYADIILLEKRRKDADRDRLQGTTSDDDLRIVYNQISRDLLKLIYGLEEKDLDLDQDFSQITKDKKVKQGSILYKVPNHMLLNEETECIVRVAFEEAQVWEGLEKAEEIKVVRRRVSNVMQATLVDPTGGGTFEIMAVNDPEQFVDEDTYTEWLFYVTPLMAGEHQLLLKVAVIELIRGNERKREVVLREKVSIATEPVKREVAFKAVKEVSVALGAEVGEEESGLEEVPKDKNEDELPDLDRVAPRLPSSKKPVPSPSEPSPQGAGSGETPDPDPSPAGPPVSSSSKRSGAFRAIRSATLILALLVVGSYVILYQWGGEGGNLADPMPEEKEEPVAPPPTMEEGDTLNLEEDRDTLQTG